MLWDLDFAEDNSNVNDTSPSNFLGASGVDKGKDCSGLIMNLIHSEEERQRAKPHPHHDEDEFWKSLYGETVFYDDNNNFQQLEWKKVEAARKLEIDFFKKL